MTDTILNSFDIWTDARAEKHRGRVRSIANISLEGIAHLRELILELAVRGKLVPQDPKDEPATKLLQKIAAEKKKLVEAGKIKKEKPLPAIAENEKPFELPTNWEWVRLVDLGITNTGKTPKTTISSYFDGDIPFIGPGQIDKSGYIDIAGTEKFLSDEGSEFSTIAESDDIVMVCIGGTIGKLAIVKNRIAFNQQLNSIRTIVIAPYYLSRALNTPYFQNMLLEKSTGSATPIINKAKWENLLIPLPPLEEQKRIVAKVDELMALCDKLEEEQTNNLKTHDALVTALLDTLVQAKDAADVQAAWQQMLPHFDTLFTTEDSIEQLKQTLLQLAVMGRLVKQNPKDEPASQLLQKIAAEKKKLIEEGKIKKEKPFPAITEKEKPFALPKGWEWVRLGDIVSILGDGIHGTPQYSDNGEYYFINGNNLDIRKIKIKPDTKTVSLEEFQKLKRPLNSRTILVSINGTIGNTAYYDNEKVILGKSACYFNILEDIDKEYIRLVITTRYFLDYAYTQATGTTIKNVSLMTMRLFMIPLPSLEEQKRIVAKVDELFALCDKLRERIIESEKLKKHLSATVIKQAVV